MSEDLTYTLWDICPACRGDGEMLYSDGEYFAECWACKGDGSWPAEPQEPADAGR